MKQTPTPSKRKRRPDWLRIQRAYVEGCLDGDRHTFPSLAELSERFGVPLRTIEEHSRLEDWPGQRAAFLRRIAAESQAEIARCLAEELSESCVTLAVRAFRRFSDIADAAYQLLKDSTDLKPRDLKVICETIKTAVEQQRLALGLTTDHKSYEISVEDWRSELIRALKEGRLTPEELEAALGREEAQEILAQAQRLSMS